MFRLCLDQRQISNRVKGLVFDCSLPSLQCRAVFGLDDLLHHALPGASGNQRIAVSQVNARQAQIHGRLLAGFIHRHEQSPRLRLVPGFQAFEAPCAGVERVIHAPPPEEQPITLFHIHASSSLSGIDSQAVKQSRRRVPAESENSLGRVATVSQTVSHWADSAP